MTNTLRSARENQAAAFQKEKLCNRQKINSVAQLVERCTRNTHTVLKDVNIMYGMQVTLDKSACKMHNCNRTVE